MAIETDFAALATATTQLATDGSTLDGAGQIPNAVTGGDGRKYIILKYTGEAAHARMKRDLERGIPPVIAATAHGTVADGVALVYDSATEVVVIARVRK